jgi:hypothetical protein
MGDAAKYSQTGLSSNVQFGKRGPRIKSGTYFEFRNLADSSYMRIKAAMGTENDDLVTKSQVPGFGFPCTPKFLNSNISTINTSFSDVTGLSFPVVANKSYNFIFDIIWQTTNANTGIGFAVNGPASPVSITGITHIVFNSISNISHYSFHIYDSNRYTSSSIAANTSFAARIEGMLMNGSNSGNLVLRFKSETGTSVSVRTGSCGILTQTVE